ncbi:MAG: efflux RND transporter periplasmic adaptor subunit [Magnetococcales bacterium]|nr:efflux RND transporter periplasmic adaptor subunit [Magnetococcales bacterium]
MKRLRCGYRVPMLLLWGCLQGVPVWANSVSSGMIKPLDDLKLSLPIAGRIDAILVKEGQTVNKGDELLHLDKSQEELEVKRRHLLWMDRAKLEELLTREKILKSQISNARALLLGKTISRKQLEDEELTLAATIAERQALEVAKEREKVEYELARDALARRFLYAPISGMVVKLHYQTGESVAANEAVIRLVDVSRICFTGNLDGKTAARIKPGHLLKVRFGTDPSAEVRQGSVVFVSPVADMASGLVEIKVEFGNTEGKVRPGFVGQLILPTDE